MKKLLLPILAMVFLMAGCQKNHVFTTYYTVEPDKWEKSITTYDDGTYVINYYYSAWRNADITKNVIDNGFVLAYLCTDSGYDELLPYTTYFSDNGNLYQERIEFDIRPGEIDFIIKDNDFHTDQSIAEIGTLQFKVVVYDN